MLFRSILVTCLISGCSSLGLNNNIDSHSKRTIASARTPSESEQRTCNSEKDCNQKVSLANGFIVGTLVSRKFSDQGVNESFIKDNASTLIWSPEPSDTSHKMYKTYKEAKTYCASKTDLGLSWRLPSKEELRVAFNPSNPDNREFASNKNLLELFKIGRAHV